MCYEIASEVFACGENADSIWNATDWSIPRGSMVVNTGCVSVLFPGTAFSTCGCHGLIRHDGALLQYSRSDGYVTPSREDTSMGREDDQEHDRLFTLSEANHLIPQLNTRIASVRQAKAVLARTKDDIRRASARAEYGGGSAAGPLYISSLHQISSNLQAIQEMGILVKDVDLGLCDFPHLRDGRVVFLCWKYGEPEIKWWHETTTGYKDRCPLEGSV